MDHDLYGKYVTPFRLFEHIPFLPRRHRHGGKWRYEGYRENEKRTVP